MEFIVHSYNEDQDYHLCRDKIGQIYRLDLFVNGDFRVGNTEKMLETNKSIIGKKIQVDYLNPFISIAMNVRVIEDEK